MEQYYLGGTALLGQDSAAWVGAGVIRYTGHIGYQWTLRKRHPGSHQNSPALELLQWKPGKEEGTVRSNFLSADRTKFRNCPLKIKAGYMAHTCNPSSQEA